MPAESGQRGDGVVLEEIQERLNKTCKEQGWSWFVRQDDDGEWVGFVELQPDRFYPRDGIARSTELDAHEALERYVAACGTQKPRDPRQLRDRARRPDPADVM
jgi:hypothetical protein